MFLVTFALGVSALSREECLAFLYAYMPESDRSLPASFFELQSEQALNTRNMFPWGSLIPDAIFLNDVLPYASLTEPRDNWRSADWFIDFMYDIVRDCGDVECAVKELNTHAWGIVDPAIVFEPSRPNEINSYSPFQTIHRGNSSCTGLSILLVDSLRAVGVPARIAGTPHWNRGGEVCPNGDEDAECGNHNWVEVWAPEKGWSWVDQRRPDKQVLALNESWFNHQAIKQGGTENHTIFASSFAPTDRMIMTKGYWAGHNVLTAQRFPLAWDWAQRSIHAWNVTASYKRAEMSEQYIFEI